VRRKKFQEGHEKTGEADIWEEGEKNNTSSDFGVTAKGSKKLMTGTRPVID